jgi:hypothetical protein
MAIKDKVIQLLNDIPQTRENDNLLIAYVIQDEYGLRNLMDVALMTKTNVYESIRRSRQKAMEDNPLLRPADDVYEARLRKEERVREEMRGL